jgi:hypothetical protein
MSFDEGNVWVPTMKAAPFGAGILIFATIVALICNVPRVPTELQQFVILGMLIVSIGVLVSIGSWVCFKCVTTSGSFLIFSLEYWLAGSTCYLLIALGGAGLSLVRRKKLYVLADWASEISASVLPKALALVELGIGIFVFVFLANQYFKTTK